MSRYSIPIQSLIFTLFTALVFTALAADASRLGPANEDGQYRYLIEFAEPGLLQLHPPAHGERFDPDTDEVAASREELQARLAGYREDIALELARIPEVTHYYLVSHSGMAAWLTSAEASAVRELPGVVSVARERIETPTTFRGPTFIGADRIWDGSAVPDGVGTRGQGMVAAILDTGVDPDHPSFANDASCGHGAGDAPDKLISLVDCSITDLDGRCSGPLPFDTQSHGTHVASTVAGNRLDETANPPPEPFAEISGVAPCAHIRSYKVCPDISCPGSMIQAGMDNVLLDGDADVMNFSISGGRNPWNDNDRKKLDIVGAGILVSASAGNTGPTIPDPVGQVNHLGPWVFTIAASTHDNVGMDLPVISASGPGTPPENTQLLVMVKGSSDVGEVPDGEAFIGKPIRRAVDDALQVNDEGCTPFSPGYFDGAVALIVRGTCTFAQKVSHAEAAGADMVVIRNNEPGALTNWAAGAPTGPAYSLSMADGQALADWIGQHPGDTTANFEFIPGQEQGDVLAGFSLRGPTPAPLQDLTKPDITAPGVSIFAAEPGLLGLLPGGYGFKSGTSMSSPHNAGAAALVRAVHPDWTVSEVKSAMMMTGFQDGTKPDATTAWDADDVGSGRVDLTRAALAGLVMDETFDNYLAANPAAGGDVKTLNISAVRNMDCTPECTWTRTVRNTLGVASDWTATGVSDDIAIEVTPSSFNFSGDTSETQTLTIKATPVGDQTAAVAFGEVEFSESGALAPDQHVTVAVRGVGSDPGDPTTVTKLDDADPAIEYRRGWHRRSDESASNGGYHRRMGSAGGTTPTARLVFEGDGITYFFGVSEQGGTADVFIDGELETTVDYFGPAPGDAPEFGQSVSFDELGEGTHEILIAHRSGAVYVDGFEIVSEGDGGADASAAETQSVTTTTTAELMGLDTELLETVEVGSDDQWLSVVVEGAPDLLTVQLLDPLGTVVADAGQLLAGSSTVGMDVEPALAGTYTIQVLDTLDSPATVEISVARTIAVE